MSEWAILKRGHSFHWANIYGPVLWRGDGFATVGLHELHKLSGPFKGAVTVKDEDLIFAPNAHAAGCAAHHVGGGLHAYAHFRRYGQEKLEASWSRAAQWLADHPSEEPADG